MSLKTGNLSAGVSTPSSDVQPNFRARFGYAVREYRQSHWPERDRQWPPCSSANDVRADAQLFFILALDRKGRSYVRDAAGRLDQTGGDGNTQRRIRQG